MITRVLTLVWLLFPTFTLFHAFPADEKTNKETVQVPNENKLTQKSVPLAGLSATEKSAKGPIQVDDKNGKQEALKHFGECEEIAEKQLDVPWSTRKNCLKILWEEAKKEQNSLKRLKSEKTVTKDIVTSGFHLLHRILWLIERIYVGVRNRIFRLLFPEIYIKPYRRYRSFY